jgi:hypothetical protein
MQVTNKPKYVPQMVWWILGSAVFVGGAAYALMTIPDFLVNQAGGGNLSLTAAERVKAVTDARQGVLLAVGGFIAIVTLLFTRTKHLLEEKKQELDQDSNWTNRYTEAIKQLGDTSISIRLGGIYALERIAQDSRRDRQTILDVLCAHLREKSPISDSPSTSQMATDLAAAATVIARVTQLSLSGNYLDLHSTNLAHAVLDGANFSSANLANADLRNARLSRTDLSYANLHKADFRGAELDGARLWEAKLTESDLSASNLEGANLRGANLQGACAKSAKMSKVNLTSADLSNAVLERTTLTDANLTRAELSDTVLFGAVFNGAQFDGSTRMQRITDGATRVTVTKQYLKLQSALEVDNATGLDEVEIEVGTGDAFISR